MRVLKRQRGLVYVAATGLLSFACTISFRPVDRDAMTVDDRSRNPDAVTQDSDGTDGTDGPTLDAPLPDDVASVIDAPGRDTLDDLAPNDVVDVVAPPDVRDVIVATDTGGCALGQILCSGSCVSSAGVRSCGRCGHDCTMLRGVNPTAVFCVAGVCGLSGACLPGLGHCTTNPDNGCETDLTLVGSCGACGLACPAGPAFSMRTCTAGTCGWECNTGYRRNGATCILDTCGNGRIDGPEQCDDGGLIAGDGCDGTCRTEGPGRVDACPGLPLIFATRGTVRSFSSTTVGATHSIAARCGMTGMSPDHTYSAAIGVGGTFNITLTPASGFDAVLQTAEACSNSPAFETCRDAAGGGGVETISLPASAGWVVTVLVEGYRAATGAYTIRMSLE